ncbi:acetolactate synthase [Tanacetum coccineum]
MNNQHPLQAMERVDRREKVKALEREGVTDVFAYPGGASIEIHKSLTRSHIIRNVLLHHEQGGVFAAEGYARASRKPDSVPLIAITGQVPRRMIGTDAFQESPIEAFYLARTGHPRPVLIDAPKDIQQQLVVPKWDEPIRLPGYLARMPMTLNEDHLYQIVWLVSEAKKRVLYAGGGCLDASEDLRHFMKLTGIPVTNTLMGLGTFL